MATADERFRAMIPGSVTVEQALEIGQALLDEEGDLAPTDFYQFEMTQLKTEDALELRKKINELRNEHFKAQGKKPPKFKGEDLGV